MPELLERVPARAAHLTALALDALPGGLAVFDPQRRLALASAGLAGLLGLADSQLQQGLPFADLVDLLRAQATPGGEPVGLRLMDASPPPSPRRFERLMPSGRRLAFTAVRLPDGSLALSAQEALPPVAAAPRPSAEAAALRRAEARVRELEDASGRFIANLGHELRTPLNAIVGMLQIVQGHDGTSSPGEYLRKAQDAARSLQDIVTHVLDCAEAHEGRLVLEPSPFSLDGLLRELSVVFSHDVGDRPVAVVFDVDPAVPDHLLGDARRLGQVLRHLGSNAIKFTAAGQAVLRITRDAGAPPGQAALAFRFEDTGPGLDAAALARLRQGLGQVDAGSTRTFGGSGLGLATSRKLLALMDSALEIHSEPGRGSRFGFRITLPAQASAPAGAVPPEDAPRVLVADTHDLRRQVLARLVRAQGWQPLEADRIESALELAAQAPRLHAALVDWRLAGTLPAGGAEPEAAFDGAQRLARALAGKAAPVVVLGSVPGSQAWSRLEPARRAPLRAFLVQPATAGLLAEAVAQAREAAGEAAGRSTPIGRPLAGVRLLLAEDNENNQLVASRLLTAQGATVTIAVDGLDALTHLVAGGEFDAILMDWQMPNMDGLETTREIRQIAGFSHLPVIALTANGSAADRAACLAAGMDAHLSKPVDAALLVRTVLEVTRPGRTPPPALTAPASSGVRPEPKAAPAATAPVLQDLPGHAPGDVTPVLDRPGAVGRLQGDEGLYDALTGLFLADTPQSLADLARSARADLREEVALAAHSLKGSAATLGASRLVQAAARVEQAFAQPAGGRDDDALAHLEDAVRLTLDALAAGTASQA